MAATIKRETHILDASGQSLGRLSTQIATLLRGKHKPSYQPHIDGGDFVKVTNISELNFTGKKLDQKLYHHSTRYPSGIRTEQLKNLAVDNPQKMLTQTVRLMLPATRLRTAMLKRLTVQ